MAWSSRGKEKKEEEEGELEDASVRNTSESLPINTLAPPNSTHLYTNRHKNKSDISYLKTSWTFEHSDPLRALLAAVLSCLAAL